MNFDRGHPGSQNRFHPTLQRMVWPALMLMVVMPAMSNPSPLDLSFMAGCWAFERNGTRYEEAWLPPTANGTVAVARAVRDGQQLHWEFTRLERTQSGHIDYVVNPSGQEPARFRLVSLEDRVATFENPDHDFPTRIIYASSEAGHLTAAIEGQQDGKQRRVEYPFRRVDCAGR